MDYEVPKKSLGMRNGLPGQKLDPCHMLTQLSGYPERVCGSRLCALWYPLSPSLTISKLMQQIKRKSSYMMLHEFKQLRHQYWGQHMWDCGYFCCSTGNVTDEMIKNYMEQQDAEDDIFRVEEEL